MNARQLGQQLQQEFARNKAKSLALLAIFLVAIYMWAPRLAGLFSTSSKKVATADATSQQEEQEQKQEKEDSPPSEPPRGVVRKWDQLVQMKASDPLMNSVALAGAKNPFLRGGVQAGAEYLADVNDDGGPEPPPPIRSSLASASIALTKTLIGDRGRWATINGKRYQEGETLNLADDDDGSAVSAQLKEVNAEEVVLSQDGLERRIVLNDDWMAMRKRVLIRHSSQRN